MTVDESALLAQNQGAGNYSEVADLIDYPIDDGSVQFGEDGFVLDDTAGGGNLTNSSILENIDVSTTLNL